MNIKELIDGYRERCDDETKPGEFNSDKRVTRWANEAQREACIRASLLFDDRSPFLQFPIAPNVSDYRLDRRVLRLTKVEFLATGTTRWRELELAGPDQLHFHGQHCGFGGRQMFKAAHISRSTLRVWPTPITATGLIRLSCYRLPKQRMDGLDDCPEIDPIHHEALVAWLVWRASMIRDSELFDPQRGADGKAEFETAFGPPVNAEHLRRHNERRRVTPRYGGF